MANKVDALAGTILPSSKLINVPKLITQYYSNIPDPHIPNQRILFGTSGHRGSSQNTTFNEWHILAITEAICLYRKKNDITGPIFLGFDTHALSFPAFVSAMEVLAAHKVDVMIAKDNEYTPTPVVSHAILSYNKKHNHGLADGIIVTPSHNPPHYGGFKYNPPSGGPASVEITTWIQNKANEILEHQLKEVKRIRYEDALHSDTLHYYDFITHYVDDLHHVIDMAIIKNTNIHIGVDPLGGAGINYWDVIKERYGLNLSVINREVDPSFYFIPADWDGSIRMDPASPYAMKSLVESKNKFDIIFACDTDHDRHGIVSHKAGLLSPNHYLSVAAFYLLKHRLNWPKQSAIGKTVVTTEMLNHIANKLKHNILEFPVGFKWFVPGLIDHTLTFCCEASAGAAFNRFDGDLWTTDKDGLTAGLLAAEITAKQQCDIADIYQDLEKEFGEMYYAHQNRKVNYLQKQKLVTISLNQLSFTKLAGDKIDHIVTQSLANQQPIDGIKITSQQGWFVVRASGTEDMIEICAESYKSKQHLQCILNDAQNFVDQLLTEISINKESIE